MLHSWINLPLAQTLLRLLSNTGKRLRRSKI
nr:MAG TPA: hypothetical protein [Caudoviricetes sp.]